MFPVKYSTSLLDIIYILRYIPITPVNNQLRALCIGWYMDLSELTSYGSPYRSLLSRMILNNGEYLNNVRKGLPFFKKEEIDKIEEKYEKTGVPLKDINEILSGKGMILKTPTFKKYVNMKLIAGTQRIEKTEKGSVGFYPPSVIREINFIKYALYSNLDVKAVFQSGLESLSTNALTIIESSFPEVLDIAANLGGVLNKRNETPYQAIEHHLDQFLEEKLVTKEQRSKILKKAAEVQDICNGIYDVTSELEKLLEDIEVPFQICLKRFMKQRKEE